MGTCFKHELKSQGTSAKDSPPQPLYETISEMPIDDSLKMALPIPGLQSRISSAHIFSLQELRKKGIKILLVLSKSTNAYIKSQDGLPGFYLTEHDNSSSWLFDVKNAYGAPLDKTPVQTGYYLRKLNP